jgi:hypothetical protein
MIAYLTPRYQLLWPAPGLDRKVLWGGTCMSFAVDPVDSKSGSSEAAFGNDRKNK